jgi:hypothetical protein
MRVVGLQDKKSHALSYSTIRDLKLASDGIRGRRR